mmetsp:Transcript_24848/g.30053  ORF Transcript_24848/g.30053 Transcript_24848/m.30053 type:complete len:119 (+) Transcript_24848:546-902(+)
MGCLISHTNYTALCKSLHSLCGTDAHAGIQYQHYCIAISALLHLLNSPSSSSSSSNSNSNVFQPTSNINGVYTPSTIHLIHHPDSVHRLSQTALTDGATTDPSFMYHSSIHHPSFTHQ